MNERVMQTFTSDIWKASEHYKHELQGYNPYKIVLSGPMLITENSTGRCLKV